MRGRAQRMALLTSAGLFLLAGALHELDHLLPPALTAVNFLTMTAIYLGLALCWAASIRQRIMNRTVRRLLVACALLCDEIADPGLAQQVMQARQLGRIDAFLLRLGDGGLSDRSA